MIVSDAGDVSVKTNSPWTVTPTFGCFGEGILTTKVGQIDLVFVCDHGSLVGLSVQDYKSLYAAGTICSTLVNIQTYTHIQTDTQTDSSWSTYLKSWLSWWW